MAKGKIEWGRMLGKLSPYTILKGLRYMKHYGPKEFWIRLHERFEPEEVPYGLWYEEYKVKPEELEKQKKKKWNYEPKISVVVPAYKTPEKFLREMIDSLLAQSYVNWELCIANASPDEAGMSQILEEYCKKDARMGVPSDEELEEQYERAVAQGADPEFVKYTKGGMTGVIGILRCGEGPTVAMRFDIDALGVFEEKDKSHRPACEGFGSVNEGFMHACGHDCHIAMLLGGIRMLMAKKEDLKGNVKIIFQAAEESCHGAQYYVEHGFLDDVDAIYGTHIWGELDAPYMNFETGPRMASCDNFRIEVEGVSSHGSTPHQGVDAILTAAYIITEIQAIVSRMNNPLNPLVVTVGKIEGGQRFNILADKVVLEGTTRTHSPEMRKKTEPLLRRIAENTAASMGAKATLTFEYFPAPIINEHEDLVQIARNAAAKMYGSDCLKPFPKMMSNPALPLFIEGVPRRGEGVQS